LITFRTGATKATAMSARRARAGPAHYLQGGMRSRKCRAGKAENGNMPARLILVGDLRLGERPTAKKELQRAAWPGPDVPRYDILVASLG
jgi:hypothetical protein